MILCASRRSDAVGAAVAADDAGSAGPLALLLHVEECDPVPLSTFNNETHNTLRLSNISLVVGESYVRYKKNSSSEKLAVDKRLSPNTQWNNDDAVLIKNNVKNMESVKQEPKHDLNRGLQTKSSNQRSASIAAGVDDATSQSARHREVLRSGARTDRIDSLLPQTETTFFQRLLLLTDELLGKPQDTDDLGIYDKILKTVETEFEAENSTLDINKIDFHLYERSNGSSGLWKPAAVLSTTSTRSLELSDEWVTTVELVNVTVPLDRWSAAGSARAAPGAPPSSAAALSAVAACGALALATSTALLLRWVATRRRRRRRRRDAVLAPADFTFPVDERRRVGEGMETMLSCWLQQLHEFGGPELERPDLLKQPPCVAPRAPSAPSSTCSVNRVTVDRRIRYKVPARKIYLFVSTYSVFA